MADLATPLDLISQSSSGPASQANQLVDAASPATIFGRRASTCALLVFGYYGGRFNGTAVANGTVTATASNTNYVVVNRSTLVVSIATTNTNWNNTTTYGRAYLLTVGASTITDYQDHRAGDSGISTPAGLAPTGTAGGDLTGTYPNPTLVTSGVTAATYGSATQAPQIALDAKGRATSASNVTVTPAVGSITGLGTGVATFLATPSSANLAAAITDETGSGAAVFATSPTLVTPTLGIATATSVNKVAITAPATSATLTVADGKTLTASNSITLAGTDSTTMTFPPASASIGYLNVPQNSQSAAYTTVLADAGKHLLHPAADTTARTFTIDSNANVAFPIGTAITFVNQNAAGTLTIAITSDTMRLAGAGTTGSRTLAANGVATALKITSTEWIISGTNLT